MRNTQVMAFCYKNALLLTIFKSALKCKYKFALNIHLIIETFVLQHCRLSAVFNLTKMKLKWVFLIPCRPSVRKSSHFHLLLQNHWANFKQTWPKHFRVKGIQVNSNKGDHVLFSRGDNYEIAKIRWRNLDLLFQCFLRWATWPMGLLLMHSKIPLACVVYSILNIEYWY